MITRLPLITLTALALSTLATLSPAATGLLIYDRDAILAGEVWRLLTGHLVHFTAAHLLTDLLVFGISGWLIEREHRWLSGGLYLTMSAAIGFALLLLDPALTRFGGLSGLAYGNVFFLALSIFQRNSGGRALARVVLIALPLKLSLDFVHPTAFLFGFASQPFITVSLSHLVGVLVAGTFFIATAKENNHVTV